MASRWEHLSRRKQTHGNYDSGDHALGAFGCVWLSEPCGRCAVSHLLFERSNMKSVAMQKLEKAQARLQELQNRKRWKYVLVQRGDDPNHLTIQRVEIKPS